MRIAKLFSAGLLALAFQACNTPKEGTNIYGTAESTDSIIVLMPSARTMDTVGVLVPDNGEFTFNTTLDSANFIVLFTDRQFNVPLFVEPDEDIKVTITGTGKERDYSVEGSETSIRIKRVSDIITGAIAHIDTLNQQSNFSGPEEGMLDKKAKLDSAFQKIVEQTQQKLRDMIDEDPGNMANIFIFPQSIGRLQLLTLEEDEAYYDKVMTALEENYAENRHFKTFKTQVQRMRDTYEMQKKMKEAASLTSPGTMAPEITLPDVNGETRKLSDLRGKIVLVDFWAAWCKPCRAENPNVVRMYDAYNTKGFEVFSVSLDGLPQQPNARDSWLKAIEQDNLKWSNHVSDLRGWNSSVVSQYGFNGIPFTVLVDRDGKIIEKNLRGPALEAKLKEVL